jgi:nucleoside 2-deoxyribosyltransferase
MREWEKKIEETFCVDLINPFYDCEGKENFSIKKMDGGEVKEGEYETYEGYEKAIVDTDIEKIRGSDGVIAVIDGSLSYGTIQEIVYARLFNKDVFLIATNGKHSHPWLKYHSTKLFTSFEDFEKEAKEIFDGK